MSPSRLASRSALIAPSWDGPVPPSIVGVISSDQISPPSSTAGYPQNRTIHQLFAEQAARTPDALAIVHGARTITYGELNRRANVLARRLHALGVGHETLVGMLIDRSIEQLISVLAILKAGAAYLPLDPAYPHERLALLLADTAAPVLIAQRRLSDRIPAGPATILWIDDVDLADSDQEGDLPSSASLDSLAYVIYTSGSTGVPKGVLIDQRGLVNHTWAMVESHALNAADRVLQFSSLSFDAAAASLFPALVVGACLVLPELALAELVGDALTRLCEAQQVTVVQLPASVWHQWVDDLVSRGHTLRAPIRVLLVGGETPFSAKLRAWLQVAGQPMTFLNAYGPTEAAITTTLFAARCDEATAAALDVIPIGRPIANKQVYLLDSQWRPVPIGAVGELCIGGVGLARGYLHQPELTAERFMMWQPEPPPGAPARPPLRLYRTGDLARLRADGNLEFIGRIDQQVKLRGFRIELGEIEVVLRRHPAVRDAVVLVREDTPGAQQLVAYLVLAGASGQPAALSQAELTAYLRAILPEYMLPAAFIELPQLPLNINGKLDRAALPAPGAERRESGWSPQTTADELLIGRLWAQALGRSQIRVHDNFFELGGHSLAAARAVALVNTALGCDLPLRLIYEAPTVDAFARALRTGIPQAHARSAADLAAEVVLDPAIRPGSSVQTAVAPQTIFLTGATGYLGIFLLQELLAHTDATIYCLVRGSHQREAAERLQHVAAHYQLPIDTHPGRVVPVPGDLRRPLLGLSQPAFSRLAKTIDHIYHAGAQVHYLYPYEALRATNVQGTAEVLRLATLGTPKPVHYISTLATVLRATGQVSVSEDDPLGPCESMRGYAQSKWVAEGLVRLAGERGLPVAIYRPGRIGSHSRTGAFNAGDFVVRLLAGCLRLGLAPNIDLQENLLPVDAAVRAIVQLAEQPPTPGARTFHLLSAHHTSWRWMLEQSVALGYQLQLVPYAAWRHELGHAIAADAGHPLLGLLPYLPPDLAAADWVDLLARHHFDTARATAGLAPHNGMHPAFGEAEFALLLAEGARRGVFPPRVKHQASSIKNHQ